MKARILRLALLVCIPVLLNGCGSEKSDAEASSHTTPRNTSLIDSGAETKNQQSKPKNMTLSDMGVDCKVRNANGSIVTYYNTIIPKSVSLSSDMLCQMASEMVDAGFRGTESIYERILCTR